MNKNLMTVQNYCKATGTNRRTVYYQIKRGALPSVTIDGVIFIDLSPEFIQQRTIRAQNLKRSPKTCMWHYINPVDEVATQGFETREITIQWAKMLSFEPSGVEVMKKRYVQLFK